ncbi:hypothetical protein ACFLZN_01395 [Nanoarchaeota archaeon]
MTKERPLHKATREYQSRKAKSLMPGFAIGILGLIIVITGIFSHVNVLTGFGVVLLFIAAYVAYGGRLVHKWFLRR